MSDLKGFSKRIKIRAAKVSENTDNLVRKIVLAVDQAVILATPVDTGRARVNWRPSIGEIISETLPEPHNASAGAQIALKAGENIASQYRGANHSPVVNITNSLPYIQYLNEGSSKQAPRNFVHLATLSVSNVFRKVRIIDSR